MLTYTSRTPTEADTERILELFFGAYPTMAFEKAKENIKSRLLNSKSFICQDGEKIVGHISQRQSQTEGDLCFLLVDPDYRKLGIGRQLMHNSTAEFEDTEKLVHGYPVTQHSHSQRICLREGYSPTKLELIIERDLGAGQRESFVHFARLYRRKTAFSAYLPAQHHEIASYILTPFCDLEIQQNLETISEEMQNALIKELQLRLESDVFSISLTSPFAPFGIIYLKTHGFYCAGFSPQIDKEGNLTFVANMGKIPQQEIAKGKIQVIPEVRPLFDFVWQQYENKG